MTRLEWEPIRERAIKYAELLGHKLGPFDTKRTRCINPVRMATCETCYGCCWIAHSPTRGFSAGGRLLKYRCGTPEAAGLLRTESGAQA